MRTLYKRAAKEATSAFSIVIVCFVLAALAWLTWGPVARAQVTAWQEPPYSPKNITFSSAGNQTILAAPGAGIAWCVYGMTLTNASSSTATTVSVYLDGGTTAVGSFYLSANGGSANWQLQANPKNPYLITNLATAFVLNSSAAVQMNGTIYAANCP